MTTASPSPDFNGLLKQLRRHRQTHLPVRQVTRRRNERRIANPQATNSLASEAARGRTGGAEERGPEAL